MLCIHLKDFSLAKSGITMAYQGSECTGKIQGATYQIATHTCSDRPHMDVMLQLDLQFPVPLQEVGSRSQNLQRAASLNNGGNTPSIKEITHTHRKAINHWLITVYRTLHDRSATTWSKSLHLSCSLGEEVVLLVNQKS